MSRRQITNELPPLQRSQRTRGCLCRIAEAVGILSKIFRHRGIAIHCVVDYGSEVTRFGLMRVHVKRSAAFETDSNISLVCGLHWGRLLPLAIPGFATHRSAYSSRQGRTGLYCPRTFSKHLVRRLAVRSRRPGLYLAPLVCRSMRLSCFPDQIPPLNRTQRMKIQLLVVLVANM